MELGTLGTGILDQACATFQDNWQTGLEKIREFTDKLAEGVESSAKQYAEVDKALRRAFTQMQETLEAPQPGRAGEVPDNGPGQ